MPCTHPVCKRKGRDKIKMTDECRLRTALNFTSLVGTYLQHLTQTHISSLLKKKKKKIPVITMHK